MATPEIPENLKADVPQTAFGKLLSATPVVMAIVATLLAGLSTSEMTQAQYDRSLAAQQQSKAGDQWGYFQAKKLRAAQQLSALDIIQSTVETRPLTAASLHQFVGELSASDGAGGTNAMPPLDSPAGQQALAALQTGRSPAAPPSPALDAKIGAALQALREGRETDVLAQLASIKDTELSVAHRSVQERAQAFDEGLKPTVQLLDQWEHGTGRQTVAAAPLDARRDFTAARLRYSAWRHETEARLNQVIAEVLELQVRSGNISAERHRIRSLRFFFGMLAAQAAVIISTLAMAARQRNLLWSLAAAAGLAAVAFALWVYLYV